MKITQPPSAWTLRSMTSNDGRRLITLWRGAEPEISRLSAVKPFPVSRRKSAAKLSVKFGSEAGCAFTPVIQSARPAARRNSLAVKSQYLKTH